MLWYFFVETSQNFLTISLKGFAYWLLFAHYKHFRLPSVYLAIFLYLYIFISSSCTERFFSKFQLQFSFPNFAAQHDFAVHYLSLSSQFLSRRMILKPLYITIRLWARNFYEILVDEAEGRRINYLNNRCLVCQGPIGW